MNTKELIQEWFRNRLGGGLVLPNGWFGRPYDNIHQLSGVLGDDEALSISLDDGQLTLNFEGPLQIEATHEELVFEGFRSLCFAWKEYGSSRPHTERFDSGVVKIVVPPGS